MREEIKEMSSQEFVESLPEWEEWGLEPKEAIDALFEKCNDRLLANFVEDILWDVYSYKDFFLEAIKHTDKLIDVIGKPNSGDSRLGEWVAEGIAYSMPEIYQGQPNLNIFSESVWKKLDGDKTGIGALVEAMINQHPIVRLKRYERTLLLNHTDLAVSYFEELFDFEEELITKEELKELKPFFSLSQELAQIYSDFMEEDFIIKPLALQKEYVRMYMGNKSAAKSGVPYFNHISEGLSVLGNIGSDNDTKLAYMLHVMYQSDKDMLRNINNTELFDFGFKVKHVILAIEYRNVANSFLSATPKENFPEHIKMLKEIKEMLIADKIQNYKDFAIHSPSWKEDDAVRAPHLEAYFQQWFDILDIDAVKMIREIFSLDLPFQYNEAISQ